MRRQGHAGEVRALRHMRSIAAYERIESELRGVDKRVLRRPLSCTCGQAASGTSCGASCGALLMKSVAGVVTE